MPAAVGRATDLVVAVRSLLRWLHVHGWIEAPLEWAVPGVADLRDRSLPRGLEAAAVKALLASCDRRRTVGRRDYAILLLARLGLRAGEIAAITLDDVDIDDGALHVRAALDDLRQDGHHGTGITTPRCVGCVAHSSDP